MPNTVTQNTLGYVDAKGEQARVRFYTSWDTLAHGEALVGSYASLLNALTNAANFSAPGGFGFLTSSGQYGTAAAYESVTDKAVMTFIDSAGQIHRFTIPAPKSGIFMADGITVNAGNTDVSNWVTLVTNDAAAAYFISTRAGLQFASFAGGLRTKKPNIRRISIFTLSSDLGEPAE